MQWLKPIWMVKNERGNTKRSRKRIKKAWDAVKTAQNKSAELQNLTNPYEPIPCFLKDT